MRSPQSAVTPPDMYYQLLPISEVAGSPTLSDSFVDCFSRVFVFSEVLAHANAVPLERFKSFAAAFLQLSAAEGLSYVAVDDQEALDHSQLRAGVTEASAAFSRRL